MACYWNILLRASPRTGTLYSPQAPRPRASRPGQRPERLPRGSAHCHGGRSSAVLNYWPVSLFRTWKGPLGSLHFIGPELSEHERRHLYMGKIIWLCLSPPIFVYTQRKVHLDDRGRGSESYLKATALRPGGARLAAFCTEGKSLRKGDPRNCSQFWPGPGKMASLSASQPFAQPSSLLPSPPSTRRLLTWGPREEQGGLTRSHFSAWAARLLKPAECRLPEP